MKNLAFLLLAALLSAHALSAQTTFSLTPIPSSVTGGPQEFDVAAHAVIKNISNVRDSIRWERNVIALPEGFNTAVCDPVRCYIPNVNTMTFGLAPGETGPMDLHFYNNLETAGSGLVHVKITNILVPTDEVTAVYIYSSTSSAHDPLPTASVRLFPNPTTEGFALENAGDVAEVQVFSLDGRQVARFQPALDQRYSVAEQPTGTYIVALLAKNGKVFQAVELQKR
jgi:hypothetical protein